MKNKFEVHVEHKFESFNLYVIVDRKLLSHCVFNASFHVCIYHFHLIAENILSAKL